MKKDTTGLYNLTDAQQSEIISIVIPKYVRDGKPVCLAWFEVFREQLHKLGYKIVPIQKGEKFETTNN